MYKSMKVILQTFESSATKHIYILFTIK